VSIDTPRRDRAGSFDLGVAAYRRARPGYPDAAARWLVPGQGCRVVDLAAGTGKLTERLHALGYLVTAVEPSHGMRRELERAVPGVWTLAGTAETIPVPDGSVDGVVVAQAWHWFRTAEALTEIRRVLRPGGRLGVTWNVRDHRVDWVEEFTQIIHRGDSLTPFHGEPTLDDTFGPVEHATFPWKHRMHVSDLRTLAASRSHTLTLPEDQREELLDAVDELTRTHPALAGREEIELPYRTECWRADLR
jgi:SAM-dependent methyltransferase